MLSGLYQTIGLMLDFAAALGVSEEDGLALGSFREGIQKYHALHIPPMLEVLLPERLDFLDDL